MQNQNINFYRINLLAGGTLVPLFYLLHYYVYPDSIDPLFLRLLFSLFSFALIAASFVWDDFKNYIRYPFLAIFYAMVIWLSYLVYANNASAPYVIAQFIWITVFATYFDSFKSLASYLIFATAVSAMGVLLLRHPIVNSVFYLLMLPSGLGINLLSLLGKIKLEKQVEDKTKELSKFKLIIENAGEHMIVTDPEGKILFANKAVEKLTGYALNEVIGRYPSLWGGQMPDDFYKELWQTIKIKKQRFQGEITNKKKDGTLYIAEADIAPILDEKGRVEFFIGIERDVTRDKTYEKDIEQKVTELNRMNNLMVDRELKMIELKKEIERLRKNAD